MTRALTAGTIFFLLSLFLGAGGAAAPPPAEKTLEAAPSGPLTARSLANLIAFTRLFGYVRFFHPSDAAAAADWNRVAVTGVRAVEQAPDAAALARALEDFFRPLAPTLRVFPAGRKPEIPAELLPPAVDTDPTVVAWYHFGGGFGGSGSHFLFRSTRLHRSIGEPGALQQSVEPATLFGRRVRFRATVRADLALPHEARLWLRVSRGPGIPDEVHDVAIPAGDWRPFAVEADVPEDARSLKVGILLRHQGSVWLDDTALEVVGGEREGATDLLRNPGFERGNPGKAPYGWTMPRGTAEEGYVAEMREEKPSEGRRCAVLFWSEPEPVLPKPFEPYYADLGGGVAAMVPMALYEVPSPPGPLSHPLPPTGSGGNQNGRVGAPLSRQGGGDGRGDGGEGLDDRRATRLGAVAAAWSALSYFYPYFDEVETDWTGALRRALTAAATDPNDISFTRTLQRLVAALHDGQARVAGPAMPRNFRFPLLWDWIEGKLVVTRILPKEVKNLAPGDAIVTFDGRPTEEVLAEVEGRISAATPDWLRFAALQDLLAGPPGQAVQVEVRPLRGGPPVTTLAYSLPPERGVEKDPKPEPWFEVEPGLFYVNLLAMTPIDVQRATVPLSEARGIVFDVRGATAASGVELPLRWAITHLAQETMELPRQSIAAFTRPDRREWQEQPVRYLSPQQLQFPKAAFLIDGGDLGATEELLTLVEHYRLAALVGSPTGGTLGETNSLFLPGGYAVWWTGTKARKQDGSHHHGVGIKPTVPVVRSRGPLAADRDEVLEKALRVVGPPVKRPEE